MGQPIRIAAADAEDRAARVVHAVALAAVVSLAGSLAWRTIQMQRILKPCEQQAPSRRHARAMTAHFRPRSCHSTFHAVTSCWIAAGSGSRTGSRCAATGVASFVCATCGPSCAARRGWSPGPDRTMRQTLAHAHAPSQPPVLHPQDEPVQQHEPEEGAKADRGVVQNGFLA
jgi:hypothetical protein